MFPASVMTGGGSAFRVLSQTKGAIFAPFKFPFLFSPFLYIYSSFFLLLIFQV
jgi:hypothetical protein